MARGQSGEYFKGAMGEPAGSGSHLRQRVLIVEDDPRDVKLSQLLLRDFSVETEIAASAEAALACLERHDMDLLLLDILLPGMDGFDLCRRLKESTRTGNIQVLFVTCLSDLESKAKGFETGGDDLLVKPINGYEFQIRVRTLLKKKEYLDRLDPLPGKTPPGGNPEKVGRTVQPGLPG